MKKTLLLFLLLIPIFVGCSLDDYSSNNNNSNPTYTSNTYESYLSYNDYLLLLDDLEESSTVNRSVINTELEELNVRQNYEYSFYDGSSYNCYTMNWNAWSSYSWDWIYYVDVDIWVNKNGSLERSMCSYYSGT
jgi:hypothetical protein